MRGVKPCGHAAAVLAAAVFALACVRPALAGGDADRGKELFEENCAVCHTMTPGYNKEGPSLAGIYGKHAGTVPLFTHYLGLKGVDVVWTDETLDAWLTDPRAFLGGRDTRMTFKLTDPTARADVIAYLKESQ